MACRQESCTEIEPEQLKQVSPRAYVSEVVPAKLTIIQPKKATGNHSESKKAIKHQKLCLTYEDPPTPPATLPLSPSHSSGILATHALTNCGRQFLQHFTLSPLLVMTI